MSVPDFESLMLPILEALAKEDALASKQIRDRLADALALSDADLEELLPSGRQPLFANRAAWATTFLKKAGLAESVKRGVVRISVRGRDVLARQPTKIDVTFLSQYEEFVRWKRPDGASREAEPVEAIASCPPAGTPEEQIEGGYQTLRRKVEEDLLEKLLAASPQFFEGLVVDLLVRMGYGGTLTDAGKAIGRSGDGGLDGIIKEDRLGLDAIYIQAKRWAVERTVGRPDVQAFAGSLEGERARKGVFITTSSFTREAEDYVKHIEKRIVLLDGRKLTSLMFEHGVGVRDKQTYAIRELDEDQFAEG